MLLPTAKRAVEDGEEFLSLASVVPTGAQLLDSLNLLCHTLFAGRYVGFGFAEILNLALTIHNSSRGKP